MTGINFNMTGAMYAKSKMGLIVQLQARVSVNYFAEMDSNSQMRIVMMATTFQAMDAPLNVRLKLGTFALVALHRILILVHNFVGI
jgi:hypothetical protein